MADFQSKFSGVEVETALRRLINWVNAGCTTAFTNVSAEEWSSYDNITVNGVEYAVIWQIEPTNYNTVYGYGLHKLTGRLYEIQNDHGTYNVSNVGSDTLNTAGSSNVNSKLFLVGTPNQNANGETSYSNINVYTEGGKLYSNRSEVVNITDDQVLNGKKEFRENVKISKYLRVNDDDLPDEDADRPENMMGEGMQDDPDLFIYSTGFNITGDDAAHNVQLSFPERSGKLGLDIEMVDLTGLDS